MSSSPTKSAPTVSLSTGDVTRVSDEVNSPAAGDNQQKTKPDVTVAEATSTESTAVKKAADPAVAGKPVAGKPAMTGGKTAKSGDQQEFVPAPPPATNAWAKRLQTPSGGAAMQTQTPSSGAATQTPSSGAATPALSSGAANAVSSSGNAIKAEVSVSDSKKENVADSSTAKSSTDKKPQKKEAEIRKTVGTSTEQTAKTSETTSATCNTSGVTTPRGTASSASGATTPRGAATSATGSTLPPAPIKSPWGALATSSSPAPRAATESSKQPQKAAVTTPAAAAAGVVQRVEKSTETETNSNTTASTTKTTTTTTKVDVQTSTVSGSRGVEVSVNAAAGTKRPPTVSKTAESTVSSATDTQTSAVVTSQEASSTTSTTSSGHVTRLDESRRWEKNPASSHRRKSKDDQHVKAAGLTDSADWPSLNKPDDNVGDSPTTSVAPTTTTDSQSTTTTTTDGAVEQQQVVSSDTSPVDTVTDTTASTTTTAPATTVTQNHVKLSSDSSADDSKDASNTSAQQQQSKKKGKGSKQKWFPLEIEIPKPRRRRGTGRPRTDSREFPEPGGRDSREGRDREGTGSEPGHETREGGTREPGSGGGGGGRRPVREGRGGGRESHDRGGARRNRRDPVDKVQRRQSESEVDGQHSDNIQSDRLRETSSSRGWNNHSPVTSNISPHNNTSPSGPLSAPARMGYQGSRRAASRGTRGGTGYSAPPRGNATNRYTQQQQQQPIWPTGAAGYSYFSFGGIDAAQFCYQVEPTAPATFFTPIVSQSDYYTSVLADEPAKKLIAQQIEYYFSRENLMKDFFLRRQMNSDGWIPVELLASFRRVRIHTGAVNVQLIVDSMAGSKVVEMSPDGKHMRTRFDPLTWSLQGVEPTKFSSLNAEVPEFVPGQPFKLSSPSLPTQVDAATPDESAATSTVTVSHRATDGRLASAELRTTPDKLTDPTTTTTTDITQQSLAAEAASSDDKESNSSAHCNSSPSPCSLPSVMESDSPAPADQSTDGATNTEEPATTGTESATTAVTTGTVSGTDAVPTPDQD